MTTIAYKNGVMASDTRSTLGNGTIHGKSVTKIKRLKNGALVGLAGDGDTRQVLALLEDTTPRKTPSKEELLSTDTDCSGIVVYPGGEVFYLVIEIGNTPRETIAQFIRRKEAYTAVGSGAPFASGAMEHGATAPEAVKVATKLDSNTGGSVRTATLNQRKKRK